MPTGIARGVCLLIGALFSAFLGPSENFWALIPFGVSILFGVGEKWVLKNEAPWIIPTLWGMGIGFGVTGIIGWVLSRLISPEGISFRVFLASSAVLLSGMGVWAFEHHAPWKSSSARRRLLDTSVIIDGRIANVCRVGFLDGELIVPRFILKELQYIADSPDTLRRNRGRRGLEVLSELRQNSDVTLRIVEDTLSHIADVDAKLVALAKRLNASVLTNDYNLKAVAELQGVTVLNLNELANAVKPEILQGETMSVRIIREGKEPTQGVGYLDDGTMVVVEGGKSYVNQTLSVEVTSVLQTSAGRMIFARVRDEPPRSEKTPNL